MFATFLRIYVPMFLLLRIPNFATLVVSDVNDRFRTVEKTENTYELDDESTVASKMATGADMSTLSTVARAFWDVGKSRTSTNAETADTSTLPTVARAFWDVVKKEEEHTTANAISDENGRSETFEEAENANELVQRSTGAMTKAIGNTCDLPTTTRAFWNSKKKKEAQRKRGNLEKDFLNQFDIASSLSTDLTKLDSDKLRLVCQISSPKQTYYSSKNPRFVNRRLRFFTSKRRKMTANLLYCPNMAAYVRESATNPSQCVYIFRRTLFRTALWLRDQKCVNLKTETTAPDPQ